MPTPPTARLAFIKLHVPDMATALAFWQEAFGFVVTGTYDLPQFLENILALPGQTESGPTLMLLQPRPDQDVTVGPGHGPLGLVVVDMQASFAHALSAGATALMDPEDVGGVIVAVLASPQGHQIELVQPLAR